MVEYKAGIWRRILEVPEHEFNIAKVKEKQCSYGRLHRVILSNGGDELE